MEFRTRPEFLVEGPTGKFLLEISPDIRLQSTRFKLPPITDYVVSHWHFDHMFGLYELHAWLELVVQSKATIYCSVAAADMLRNQFDFIPINIVTLEAFKPFTLHGVTITPIPVYHMRSRDEGKAELELNNTFGFVLEADDQKVSYLADYYHIPNSSVQKVQGSDVVIADGTYLFQEQYPDKPYQNATSEEDDPDHLHGSDILTFTQSLGAPKTVYHSITHLPEKEHAELQSLLPDTQYVGYDGLNI